MNKEDIEFIRELIYDRSKEEVIEEIGRITDSHVLYVYLRNYNWDDGLDIPRAVLSNRNCDLSTALSAFYLAEGERYLCGREALKKAEPTEWFVFISDLHRRITRGDFIKSDTLFEPPLSKVQLYKINKLLPPEEAIFTQTFGRVDLNITV